jgi:hypothetical protein
MSHENLCILRVLSFIEPSVIKVKPMHIAEGNFHICSVIALWEATGTQNPSDKRFTYPRSHGSAERSNWDGEKGSMRRETLSMLCP